MLKKNLSGFIPMRARTTHKEQIPYAAVEEALTPVLRRDAELDPTWRQVIPYALVYDRISREYFVTRRIKGDERLIGQLSAGTGGHIEEGETILAAAKREVEEELFIHAAQPIALRYEGWLRLNEKEVDKVHLGCVIRLGVTGPVSVRETDTLEGQWMTRDELVANYDRLESWTQVLVDAKVI